MLIRKLSFSDFGDLLPIYETGYSEVKADPDYGDYLYLKKPSLGKRRELFRHIYKDMLNGDSLYYVAEDKGKVIGFASARKKDTPDSEMSHIGVIGVRVAKEFRGRGIGTALLRKVIAKCAVKFDILEIYVLRVNKKAIALYRRLGFKTWGIAPGYIKRGKRYIDMEYMYLKL